MNVTMVVLGVITVLVQPDLCYIVRERRGGVHNAEFLALYMYFYV